MQRTGATRVKNKLEEQIVDPRFFRKYLDLVIEAEQTPTYDANFIKDYMTKYHLKPGEKLHPDYENHLNSYDKFELKKIPLDSIPSELGGLDKTKVQNYKTQSTSTAPPIVYNGTDNHILDGYHRVNAAKERGDSHIMAYVGTRKPPIDMKSAGIKGGGGSGGVGVPDTRDMHLGAELDPKAMMARNK